jgi:hypothetical protein
MLVGRKDLLIALQEAKERGISIETLDRNGERSNEKFSIDEVKEFQTANGTRAVTLILQSVGGVTVMEVDKLNGIWLAENLWVHGNSINELTVERNV